MLKLATLARAELINKKCEAGIDALERLIEIALRDTEQSAAVANFLLAWVNPLQYGGFPLLDICLVDDMTAKDMVKFIAFACQTRVHAHHLPHLIYDRLDDIARARRTQFFDD